MVSAEVSPSVGAKPHIRGSMTLTVIVGRLFIFGSASYYIDIICPFLEV